MYPLLTLNKYKAVGMLTIEIYKLLVGLAPQIMSDLFVPREDKFNLRNFQALEFPRKRTVKFRTETYFLQGTSNMELDPGKIEDISNIKKIEKIKNGRLMPAHEECAKHTFNVP